MVDSQYEIQNVTDIVDVMYSGCGLLDRDEWRLLQTSYARF